MLICIKKFQRNKYYKADFQLLEVVNFFTVLSDIKKVKILLAKGSGNV